MTLGQRGNHLDDSESDERCAAQADELNESFMRFYCYSHKNKRNVQEENLEGKSDDIFLTERRVQGGEKK